MGDIAAQILESMEIIANGIFADLKFDTTIKAIITKVEEDSEEYICQYNETKLTAYGEANAYSVDDTVYILIPQGDWNAQKHIINKAYNAVQQKEVYNPFKNIINEVSFVEDTNKYSVIANFNSSKESKTKVFRDKPIISFFSGDQYYDTLGVRFKINPSGTGEGNKKGLSYYNVIRDKKKSLNCTYGIRFTIYDKFFDDDIVEVKKVFEYTTEDMIGNLYNFYGDIYQEAVFDISDITINNRTMLQMEFFEKGDFGVRNGSTTSLLEYPGNPDGDIVLKDVNVVFGVDTTKHGINEIVLRFLSDSHLYYWAWSEDENKKLIKYIIYNKTDELQTDDIKLYYSINDSDEWTEVDDSWLYAGEYILPPLEQRRQSKIRFKYRAKVFPSGNYEDETQEQLYTWSESNEAVCQRYRLSDSNLEDEQNKAIKLSYQYSYGIDLTRKWEESQKNENTETCFVETDSLKYVGYDNKLRTKVEAYSPHFIHMLWEPTETMFKDPTYLAGAKITWKVPTAYNTLIEEELKADEEGKTLSNEDKMKCKLDYFNQNLNTVFMPAKEGTEYCYGDEVTYEKDEKQGIYYLTLSHTFSDDFEYDGALHRRYLSYAGLPKKSYTHNEKDWFYLTWRFRAKEYYFSSMKYNKISCTITKGEFKFTKEFDLSVTKSSNAQRANPKLISENFEPVACYWDSKKSVETQIIHFIPYMEDYSSDIIDNELISCSIMREVTNSGVSVEKGYHSNGEKLGDKGFYTLTINSGSSFNGLKSLSIKSTASGRSIYSINPIPLIVSDKSNNYGNIIKFIDGKYKLYVNATGELMDEGGDVNKALKLETVILPKNDNVNYQVFSNSSKINTNIELGVLYNYSTLGLTATNIVKADYGTENVYYYPVLKSYTAGGYEFKYLTCSSIILSPELMENGNFGVLPSTSIFNSSVDTVPCVSATVARFNKFSDDFNVWDGESVLINKDSVFASAFAAGSKDSQGQFSGVIMGKIGKVDEGVAGVYGIYGYDKNEKSYKLTQDGKATFGKDGSGQIIIDGTSGVIKSGAWDKNRSGMWIDLDDGIQRYKNDNYYMTFDVSDSNVGSAEKFPIKIGSPDSETGVVSAKFKVNWKGELYCKDAILNDISVYNALLALMDEEGNVTTIIDGSGNVSSGLKFPEDYHFNKVWTSNLVVGDKGETNTITIKGNNIDFIGTKSQTFAVFDPNDSTKKVGICTVTFPNIVTYS